MHRRSVLGTVTLLSLAGCSSPGQKTDEQKEVGIWIQNNTQQERRVHVEITNEDEVLNTSYVVEPASTLKKDGILDAGTYTVAVSVTDVETVSTEWTMSGCEENNIEVLFDADSVDVGATCHDD